MICECTNPSLTRSSAKRRRAVGWLLVGIHPAQLVAPLGVASRLALRRLFSWIHKKIARKAKL